MGQSPPLRIALVSTVPPVVDQLVAILRELGHDPVAVVSARTARREGAPSALGSEQLVAAAPPGVDVVLPASKERLAAYLRATAPELVLCWGYPWKLAPEALAVPRLGCVNQHPALLPRHRGPAPLAWALREGDPAFGLTWHRMDAEFDTGAILAQTSVPIDDDDVSIDTIGPKLGAAAFGLLPAVLARVAARDPGDPQPTEGASWAPFLEADFAEIDWGRTAREVHNQVRAWALTFGHGPVRGPLTTLAGERVRILRTSLAERPDAVARVEAGDGPLWVLAHEPA